MITHSIRTSKYKTTIDIPAEKLHTRSKFIQIPKASNDRQQTIIIPNGCYQKQRQKTQMTLEAKLMIEQLEDAYNQDIRDYEQKLQTLKTSNQISKIKLQNIIEYQKRQIQILKATSSQFQRKFNQSNQSQSSNLSKLQIQLKTKENNLNNKDKIIGQLQNKIDKLAKEVNQKSNLLSSRFKQIQIQKDKIYRQEKLQFNKRIQGYKQLLQNINNELRLSKDNNTGLMDKLSSLQNKYQNLEVQNKQLKELNDFQSKQIEGYIQNLKQTQKQKVHILNQNDSLQNDIKQQNHSIDQLLQQMKLQKFAIQNLKNQSSNSEIRFIAQKLQDYEVIFAQKQKQLVESKSQYLLKLKQIDDERLLRKQAEIQVKKSKQQIKNLNIQLSKQRSQFNKLSNQLTKKILQFNQLENRKPQEKVYQVKIEKTIDRKEYIQKLQNKIQELEKIIQTIKQENQSYIEEVRRKVLSEKQARSKQKVLQKSVEQLKSYIAKKQNSVSWVVQRQIAKDVQISRDNSQKSNGYKVYVKNSSSNQSQQDQEVSGINKVDAINFSIQSKIDKILQQRNGSSQDVDKSV